MWLKPMLNLVQSVPSIISEVEDDLPVGNLLPNSPELTYSAYFHYEFSHKDGPRTPKKLIKSEVPQINIRAMEWGGIW